MMNSISISSATINPITINYINMLSIIMKKVRFFSRFFPFLRAGMPGVKAGFESSSTCPTFRVCRKGRFVQ